MTQTLRLINQAAQLLHDEYALNKNDKKNLEKLFEAYKNPTSTQTQILDKRTAAAYVIARGLSIAGVIRKILAENAIQFSSTHSIVDFGGGPGTFLWEYLEHFQISHYTNIDTNSALLGIFKDLCLKFVQPKTVLSVQQDYFSHNNDNTYDLGVMSYTLCENHQPLRLVAHAADFCKKILIIEPGTPLGYQNVLLARDALLAKGFNILAPCTTQGPCPMANQDDDWCHFIARIERTKQQMFLKSAEKSFEDEKYIYLFASQLQHPSQTGVRLLAKPKLVAHGAEIIYCQDIEIHKLKMDKKENFKLQPVIVYKKSQKQLYKQIKKANRGDLIQIKPDLGPK